MRRTVLALCLTIAVCAIPTFEPRGWAASYEGMRWGMHGLVLTYGQPESDVSVLQIRCGSARHAAKLSYHSLLDRRPRAVEALHVDVNGAMLRLPAKTFPHESTGLLVYETDVPLAMLKGWAGQRTAVGVDKFLDKPLDPTPQEAIERLVLGCNR